VLSKPWDTLADFTLEYRAKRSLSLRQSMMSAERSPPETIHCLESLRRPTVYNPDRLTLPLVSSRSLSLHR
jgi:hypothetical protein